MYFRSHAHSVVFLCLKINIKMKTLQKGDKKLLNAWAFYDWANSVYTLVIASAIFPIFYEFIFKERGNNYVDIYGYHCKDTAMITFVTALAFLIVKPVMVVNSMNSLKMSLAKSSLACSKVAKSNFLISSISS